MLMRRQFVLTLALMPITFGMWYAAGTLFAAPAVWLCDFIPESATQASSSSGPARGGDDGAHTVRRDRRRIMPASQAGNQIALEINTRLVSYSIAFYAALLMASNLQDACTNFASAFSGCGSSWLWPGVHTRQRPAVMVGGALSRIARRAARQTSSHSPISSMCCSCRRWHPSACGSGSCRGSPLWEALASDIKRASR